MEKQAYLPKVIEWVKRNGFDEIRANMEGFTTPVAYEQQNGQVRLIPDVTAKSLFEKSYFEIVLKSEDLSKMVIKLHLLSVLAHYKGGRLFLMAPAGHFNFAKSIAEKYNIYSKIIKIT
ncbi:MAG: hypothetical protein U0X91_20470 [Spirosomataceae bacterium]